MENGQLPDDKLFRAVHDRLSDYEAPYNGADWDAMSRSLDSLPKTTRFQWKISLNSILVILGVTGLSVLSYAVATHTSHGNLAQPETKITAPITTNQPQNNAVVLNTSLPVNNITPSAFDTQQEPNMVSNTTPGVSDNNPLAMADANNGVAGQDGKTRIKKRNNSDLFFGDQIDPKKGFIRKTQEDKDALTPPLTITDPKVFYDLDNEGHVKKIILKDSTLSKKTKTFNADTTANNSAPFAPTNGEGGGFGDPQAQE